MGFMPKVLTTPRYFPLCWGLEQGLVLRSRVPMTSAIYFFLLKMSLPLDLSLSVPDMAENGFTIPCVH